jgi:hypothetical protein
MPACFGVPPAAAARIPSIRSRSRVHGAFAPTALSLEGPGWPTFKGTWKSAAIRHRDRHARGPEGCDKAARYRVRARRGTSGSTSCLTTAFRGG